MTPMEWFREKLFGRAHDLYRDALVASDETTTQLRSLRQQLEPFRLEDDPFIAMTRKRLIAEAFESRQESEIFRGPAP